MSDTEQGATVVELLLREPEVVAWLGGRHPEQRDEEHDEDDFEPPHAA